MSDQQLEEALEVKPMTIEEMFQKYEKRYVENAILTRNYKQKKQQMIDDIHKQIADGINVEGCKRVLEAYARETPSGPSVDPTEPDDLDEDVKWRMRVIKYTYHDATDVDEKELINRDAILQAYREKKLEVDGRITVWFAGKLVMGPLLRSDFKSEHVIDMISHWTEEYGPGRHWIEEDVGEYIQRMQSAIVAATDEDGHHVFAVMVRLLGVQEFTIVPNVLDDTGSTFFELYADDAQRLGLTQSYGGWGRRVSLNTANGKIRRQIFAVEIQLLLNGVPFGDITRISATLTPTNSDGDYRCSGTWLRKLWFTATSPYGNDSLYMSDRKTGVVRPLPS